MDKSGSIWSRIVKKTDPCRDLFYLLLAISISNTVSGKLELPQIITLLLLRWFTQLSTFGGALIRASNQINL